MKWYDWALLFLNIVSVVGLLFHGDLSWWRIILLVMNILAIAGFFCKLRVYS